MTTNLRTTLRHILPVGASRFLRRTAGRAFPASGRIGEGDVAARRFWQGVASAWGAVTGTGLAGARGYAELVRAHLYLDNLEAAEAAASRGLLKYPVHFGLRELAAQVAMRRRDWPEAVERWRSIVDQAGGNASAETVARLVRALRHAGRREEARARLDDALAQDPTNMKLLCERAFNGNSVVGESASGSATQSKTVEIVVCVHNALDDVENCLRSIREKTTKPYTLTIIDDASAARVATFLDDFVRGDPDCRVLRNVDNLGYTRSANIGLRQANADWVVLLNSDTIVTTGWIEGLIDGISSGLRIGAVGPLSNTANLQSVPHMRAPNGNFAFNRLPSGVSPDEAAKIVHDTSARAFPRVPLLNGFCTMFARRALDEVGYLDEVSFPQGYGEEHDLCLRLVSAGYDLAIADHTYVYHAKSASFGSTKREALIDRSIRHNETKWPGYSYAYAAEGVELIEPLTELRSRLEPRL